ncbi:SRPBCC family protein [Plantactinospora sp. GCM10030261]|uniref:SRPBCC family protein n=1 Tax=Plantactinospora sp. GCM10030261 TaxID=3273420 RepID=UPI00360D7075
MSQESRSSGGGQGGVGGKLLAGLANLAGALGDRAVGAVTDRIDKLTDRLTGYGQQGASPTRVAAAKGAEKLREGGSPIGAMLSAGAAGGKEQVKQPVGKGGGRKDQTDLKVTNIVESIDVGVPVRIAYDQWTQFTDFPSFMKKVENIEQDADEKLTWKAQVLWSHRTWESTIIEQVPDERIVWRSKGQKGSVDGTVSFHELAEDLTRILVVLEYHPQGFFERTGNLWRAQGRRVRLELKHFVRHVMTRTILDPDELQGWRGEIREGEVVMDDETARRQEGHPG